MLFTSVADYNSYPGCMSVTKKSNPAFKNIGVSFCCFFFLNFMIISSFFLPKLAVSGNNKLFLNAKRNIQKTLYGSRLQLHIHMNKI